MYKDEKSDQEDMQIKKIKSYSNTIMKMAEKVGLDPVDCATALVHCFVLLISSCDRKPTKEEFIDIVGGIWDIENKEGYL